MKENKIRFLGNHILYLYKTLTLKILVLEVPLNFTNKEILWKKIKNKSEK